MQHSKVTPPPPLELNGSMILEGDAYVALQRIPDNSIQCVVTSPPYWSLRDYNIKGQIGLDESVYQYINTMVILFREVRRVLKPDGLLWLNIGDSFTSGGRTWRAPDKKNQARAMSVRPDTPEGLKAKDLIGVPWRMAFALQIDGWYLRSDNIWHKPNCMPESVKDRPTRAHEYVFMFSKSEQYFYASDAAREANGRNRRTVWSIPTQAFPEAHFATFPTTLVQPCIVAASRPGDYVLDPFFGSGTVGAVAQELGRHYIGIELNPEYVEIAKRRIAAAPEFNSNTVPGQDQVQAKATAAEVRANEAEARARSAELIALAWEATATEAEARANAQGASREVIVRATIEASQARVEAADAKLEAAKASCEAAQAKADAALAWGEVLELELNGKRQVEPVPEPGAADSSPCNPDASRGTTRGTDESEEL